MTGETGGGLGEWAPLLFEDDVLLEGPLAGQEVEAG